MLEERRQAGHGGDDQADHVFGKAVEDDRVSFGVLRMIREDSDEVCVLELG